MSDDIHSQVAAAQASFTRNLDGMRSGVIRPIELQQAISGLATARRQRLDAILDYNLAQLELLRAIGRPPLTGTEELASQ